MNSFNMGIVLSFLFFSFLFTILRLFDTFFFAFNKRIHHVFFKLLIGKPQFAEDKSEHT